MKQTIQTSVSATRSVHLPLVERSADHAVRHARLVKMVVDPLTGSKVLVHPLTGRNEGMYLRLRLMYIPKSFRRVHRFIRAGTENREWVAYLAHKGTEDWPYRGMPLSTVIAYLKWRGTL